MKFAVSFFSCVDNELSTEIIEADNWREAAIKHSKSFWNALVENDPEDFENPEDADNEILDIVPQTLEEAKQEAFDQDSAFGCVEVK